MIRTIAAVSIASIVFAAIPALGDEAAWNACEVKPSQDCVLTLAQSSLSEVQDDRAWIAAAAELAQAFKASARRDDGVTLLEQALSKAGMLEDPTKRTDALAEIGSTFVKLGENKRALSTVAQAETAAQEIEDQTKRNDLIGKLASTRAGAGDIEGGLAIAMAMPEGDYALDAYKARTFHEIAPIQAKHGDFDGARETLGAITMGIVYYQSTARADVAQAADVKGQPELAAEILQEAEDIARGQDDGYFIAGALRHIGEAHSAAGRDDIAITFFEDALDGARTAKTRQEQARALSRVATAYADYRHYVRAIAVFSESLEIMDGEESEALRNWAHYEIAGSLGFTGDFDRATELLAVIPSTPMGSSASLKSAAQRDVAWGMARHNRVTDALELAAQIETPREQVQALSRIVRIMSDPDMIALARYL